MAFTAQLSALTRSRRLAGALAAGAGLAYVGGGIYTIWYAYNFVPVEYGWERDFSIGLGWFIALVGLPALITGSVLAVSRRGRGLTIFSIGVLTALTALALALTLSAWLLRSADPVPALVIALLAAYLAAALAVALRSPVSPSAHSDHQSASKIG